MKKNNEVFAKIFAPQCAYVAQSMASYMEYLNRVGR